MTVSASQHGRTVATETVSYRKDHDRYRLSLPPGRYVVRAPRSGDPAQVVVRLRPGQRVTVNFPDYCK